MDESGLVLVGVIGRPHGLRGEVSVRATTDFVVDRFASGAELTSEGGPLVVAGHRWHQGVLLVSFDGHVDRSAAESLRGRELWATEGADLAVDEGEFRDRDLIGLQVRVSGAAEPVGVVRAIRHLPAQDLLVLDIGGQERLVPFVHDLVPVVDVAAGWLSVTDLPGLLDDSAETTDED